MGSHFSHIIIVNWIVDDTRFYGMEPSSAIRIESLLGGLRDSGSYVSEITFAHTFWGRPTSFLPRRPRPESFLRLPGTVNTGSWERVGLPVSPDPGRSRRRT